MNPGNLLVLCALLMLGLGACDSGSKHHALPAGTTVIAFGDSVTQGTGAKPVEAVSLDQKGPGKEVTNATVEMKRRNPR